MAGTGNNGEVQLEKGQVEVTHSTGESSSLLIGERPCLVELKNGKVILKQKIISFEKQSETLQEIVKFREFLQARIDKKDSPLSEIPDNYKPVVAKMAHESDKTLGTLAKYIRQELLPTQGDNAAGESSSSVDVLPQSLVETAIKSIMNRNNYGLSLPNGGKAPAAVCLWRWEVKEEHWDWLPKSSREKAEQRLTERALAREDLQILFAALPQEEQTAILNPKAIKTHAKTVNEECLPPESSPLKLGLDIDARPRSGQDGEINSTRAKGRPKKALDPDKLAKDKERLDKKAAKAEKEKKAKDAQDKSRSIMTGFLSKKVPATKACIIDANKGCGDASGARSEFSKTFKPYLVKKGAQLAPTNWFLDTRSKRKFVPHRAKEIIAIDDDDDSPQDILMEDPPLETFSVSAMSAKDRLQDILSSLTQVGQTRPPSYKTYHPFSIREIMSQLAEAEVSDNDGLVRSLLAKLQDRAAFPARAFIFHEDARPGYLGTWTRNSKVVGARTPLAKDLAGIDYSYDSGEEWEDEGNADADDVLDDDDEDPADDETDSDLDNWLVDDDDADVDVNPHNAELRPPELQEPSSLSPPKRKVENENRQSEKRRKVVVPLVPFAKGPCWESTIGNCDFDALKAYKMRVFNDTPFPVDPFTFVSIGVEDKNASHRSCGSNLGDVRNESSTPSYRSNSAPFVPPKKPAAALKNAFPDAHVPFLLTKITALQAASLTFLVETIYQELRVHKVKKNAVEAKVREVGEKCKEKRVWVVKSAFKLDDPPP